MKIIQRIVFIGAFAVNAVYFVYTLCFSTPWANGLRYGDFYMIAQHVNHVLFDRGFVALVLASLILLFGTHKNRNLYITNYFAIGASAWWMLETAAVTMTLVPPLEPLYLALPDLSHRIVTAGNGTLKPTTIIFDVAPYLNQALIAATVLVVAFTLYQTVEQTCRKIRRMRLLREAKR